MLCVPDFEQEGEIYVKVKAAVYVRSATDEVNTDKKIEGHLAEIRNYAETHNMQIVEEVVDKGVSGSTLDRPGVARVRQLVADGAVPAITVPASHHVSRESADILLLEEEFAARNVQIILLDQNPGGVPLESARALLNRLPKR